MEVIDVDTDTKIKREGVDFVDESEEFYYYCHNDEGDDDDDQVPQEFDEFLGKQDELSSGDGGSDEEIVEEDNSLLPTSPPPRPNGEEAPTGPTPADDAGKHKDGQLVVQFGINKKYKSTETRFIRKAKKLKTSTEQQSFDCLHCSEPTINFKSPEELRSHMVYTHPIEYCPGEIPHDFSETQLESGIRLLVLRCKESSWGRGKFGCAFCWKQLPTEVQQREHLLETHWDQVMMSSTKTEAQLVNQQHHEKGKSSSSSSWHPYPRGLMCDHCGSVLSNTRRLRAHQLFSHPTQLFANDLPKGTTEKDVKAAYKLTVRRDRRVFNQYHGLVRESYLCPLCLKTVGHRLRAHIWTEHLDTLISNLKKRTKASTTTPSSQEEDEGQKKDDDDEGGGGTDEGSLEFQNEAKKKTSESSSTDTTADPPPSPPGTSISTDNVIKTEVADPPLENLDQDQIDIKEEVYTEVLLSDPNLLSEPEHPSSIKTEPEPEEHSLTTRCTTPEYFDPSKPPPIACPHCPNKTCSTFGDLDVHLVFNHTFSFYSHLLPPATSDLVLKTALELHYRKRIKQRKYGFQCLECDWWGERRFLVLLHLRHHPELVLSEVEKQERKIGRLEVALKANPFCCPVCRARFFYYDQVGSHLKSEHGLPMFGRKHKYS